MSSWVLRSCFLIVVIASLVIGSTAEPSSEYLECDGSGECASGSSAQKNYKSVLHIQEVDLMRFDDPDQEFAEEVASLGRPVVVKSALLRQKWKAIGRWTNSYMISAMCPGSILYPVYITKNHTFWLHRSHSEIYNWDSAPKPYDQTNMTVADFFLRLHDPETHGHFYYSEPVNRLTQALADDVSPVDFLNPFPSGNREITQPIWMGSRGVTTQLHYDTNYNFHVQVDGHKHFLLFPPESMRHVYLFPRIHPHFRRSQVNLDSIDTRKFPSFSPELLKGTIQVTLESGDALYIPPFWGHHVTNVDGGVSVNVWTENSEFKSWSSSAWRLCEVYSKSSRLTRFLTDLFSKVLSVPKNVAPGDRLKAFTYFIKQFLKTLKLDVKSTMQELHSQRYKPLAAAMSPSARDSATTEENSIFVATKAHISQCHGHETLPEGWTKQLSPKAAQVAELFLGFQPNHDAEGIRSIILFDYLDASALSAVQNNHNLVADFLANCFSSP